MRRNVWTQCRQAVATALVLTLTATACSEASPEPNTTLRDPAATVNEALGTQAVQDFLIHLDMLVQTDDQPVSYYREVLDHAAAGSIEPVELAGGLTLSRVTSLQGHMVDANQDELASIAVDFGLLGFASGEFEAFRSRLADALAAAGHAAASDLIAVTEEADSNLLVELVTAGYTTQRTHANPGDRASVDLTFVDAIAPGDAVTSIYLFGQTHPGDPLAEAGLSSHELFAYRWDHGLISLLGTSEGLSAVADATVDLVEGSTIRQQEVKAFLAFSAGALAGQGFAEGLLEGEGGDVIMGENVGVYEGVYIFPVKGEVGLAIPGPKGTAGSEIVTVPRWQFTSFFALRLGTSLCLGLLPAMLARNRAEAAISQKVGVWQGGDFSMLAAIDEIVNGTKTVPADIDDEGIKELCDNVRPAGPHTVGGTFGDVHITTFDGWSYDNQAAGEFLLFDNGVATVQLRLEPWSDSDAVSVVTAAAISVGDHEASMHQGGRLWVDGEQADLARGQSIGVGDAALVWTGTGWFIVWPDGTEVRVTGGQPEPYADPATPNYSPLVVLVYPSDQPVTGMIGSPDGDGDNDWVTRSGDQLDSDIRFDFDAFYPTYIDTWRISQGESLFHYEQGESTETFTVDGFPRVRYDLADLDPEVVADAEAACLEGGVERPEILKACTVDVALTGDYRFVFDAYVIESATFGVIEPASDPVVKGPPADGDNIVTVGPMSLGFGAEPPTVLPNSNVQWECQAAEGSLFATSRFLEAADRYYNVRIEYLDAARSPTGDESFTLIVELNDEPIVWMLNWADPVPGSLESVDLSGSVLTAVGTAVLNQPLNPVLFPGSALPAGTQFEPFDLHVNCSK